MNLEELYQRKIIFDIDGEEFSGLVTDYWLDDNGEQVIEIDDSTAFLVTTMQNVELLEDI